MPKAKITKAKKGTLNKAVRVTRSSENNLKGQGFFEKLQSDIQQNNSLLNLILGGLILVVLGILIFNYFNKNNDSDLGPSQQTQNQEQTDQTAFKDVTKENLPGKYTVKEGDTLFLIAQKYYNDGYKYNKLVEVNKLADENNIEVGKVLEIPKIEDQLSQATPLPTTSPTATPQAQAKLSDNGTGGAENQTIWGEKITGNTYTVQAEDWLSKIAGRAYGDILQYEKIAKANNIQNPDLIEPGTVLKIPR